MFDSLDEQMKHDDNEVTTPKERMMKHVLVALVSVLLFGGLYMSVRLLG